MRQHYACSGDVYKHFKIFVIQKLPGSGRISEQTENFTIGQINPVITNTRKKIEDNWIRKLHTQYRTHLDVTTESTASKTNHIIIVNLQNLYPLKTRG